LLVVEDDRMLGEALVLLFRTEGYDVRYARDGVDALTAVDSEVPDVIVSDVMMPRLDGHELVASVRGRGFSTPIVLISANHAAPRHPGVSFLAKPFDVDRLLELVDEVMRAANHRNGAAGA
jgi:DNA-binding response OmpR family regulator